MMVDHVQYKQSSEFGETHREESVTSDIQCHELAEPGFIRRFFIKVQEDEILLD